MIKNIQLLIFLGCLQAHVLLNAEQPITLFSHGIVANHTQMNRYTEGIMSPYQSFDYNDAQIPTDVDLNTLIFTASGQFGKHVNRNQMAMGHGQDILTLKNQINPDKKYILYGVSRGGATIVSYLAQHNPTNIAALVLDSAPADIVDAINGWQYAIGYKFAPNRAMQETIFHNLFPAYPLNSTPAVDDIKNIHNKELPIFIVNSRDDARVPIASAWQLYRAFRQAGFAHVYICQLEHGIHAHYLQGPDTINYLQALHSFYKAYGFAYNPTYATIQDLSSLQPSVENITQNLQRFAKKMEQSYMQQQRYNKNYSYGAIAILITAGIVHTVLSPQIESAHYK